MNSSKTLSKVSEMEAFGIEKIPLFFLFSFILCLIPGVDMAFILNRTFASPNRRAPLMAVWGITCGLLVHTSLVAFGLGLFLAHSPLAFNSIRLLGAVYLFWLGMGAFRAGNTGLELAPENRDRVSGNERDDGQDGRDSLFRTWFQGFCVNILNPKVVIFFLSYLPQFIVSSCSSTTLPLLLLGGMFCVVGTVWNTFLVFAGGFVRDHFLNNAARLLWMNRCAGGIFILLAVQIFWEIFFF